MMLRSVRDWRVGRPTTRQLWRLLAVLLAVQSLLLSLATQTIETFINACLVWVFALLVMNGEGCLPRRLYPTPLGCVVGSALIVAVLWRSPSLVSGDKIRYVLPLISGVGLALLARPWRHISRFAPVLMILALLPPMRLITLRAPVEHLSDVTAAFAEILLILCGLPTQRSGQVLVIPGGAISVVGPCSGVAIMVQLVAVSLIFLMVFPMRYRWQNFVMMAVAPLLGFLINGLRIAMLAVIMASTYSGKQWWFEFFHHHWGSQVFTGVGMLLFVVVYARWQGRQVAELMEP